MQQIQKLSSTEKVRCYDLLRVVLTWALWPRPKPQHSKFVEVVKGLQTDTDQQKEIGDMTNRLGPTIEDIVRAEVEVTTSRETLLKILEDRFGSVSQEMQNCVNQADSFEVLQNAIRQVHKGDKFEDLRL